MVAILRGEPGWVHPTYGLGHDFVKEMGKRAQKSGRPLLEVAFSDGEFRNLYDRLSVEKQKILSGQLELYTGSSAQRAEINRVYARSVAARR